MNRTTAAVGGRAAPRVRFSAAAGWALRGVFAGITLVRRPRPIHPRGVELSGAVTWLGSSQSGVRWIDEPPPETQQVTARVSRSIGLPAPLPDVIGLALRLRLHVARPRGTWHPFAELELRAPPGPLDSPLRFDAGRRLLPGARMPHWVRVLRQPSYDLVQRDERDAGDASAHSG